MTQEQKDTILFELDSLVSSIQDIEVSSYSEAIYVITEAVHDNKISPEKVFYDLDLDISPQQILSSISIKPEDIAYYYAYTNPHSGSVLLKELEYYKQLGRI